MVNSKEEIINKDSMRTSYVRFRFDTAGLEEESVLMILTPTTFVIGAGASASYGLPTGEGLLERARQLQPNSTIYHLILRASSSAKDLADVLADLKDHTANSIDYYLETRASEKNTMLTGKAIIAGLMAEALLQPAEITAPDDWLGFLFERMCEGVNSAEMFVDKNKHVNFVTFNFDSMIEYRFRKDLARTFRDGKDWKGEVPHIIHVHGKLPTHPDQYPEPILYQTTDMRLQKGFTQDWINWITTAAMNVNVVIDDIEKETLDAAQDAIRSARNICFLGFAYAKANLSRLDIPNSLMRGSLVDPGVFGSAFHVYPSNRDTIHTRLAGKIRLGEFEHRCKDVLQHLPMFPD